MENMTKENIEALLGRSLSDVEVTNFDLYLKIAGLRLTDLICTVPDPMPEDLQLLLARLFDSIAKENTQEAGNVASKRVEDFQINYREGASSVFDEVVNNNNSVIQKYSTCSAGIRCGSVRDDSFRLI